MRQHDSAKRRPRGRWWRIPLLAVATLVLLACSYAGLFWYVILPGYSWTSRAALKLPAPTGSHAVGRRCFDWTDPSRVESFDKSYNRELMVWVWYPAAQDSEAKPGFRLPGQWGRATAKWEALDLHLHTHSFLSALTHAPAMPSAALENLQANSVDNAPLCTGQQRFPILLFEPGLGQMTTDYTALLEDIASDGYIVVGINPTYFCWATVFSDGRQVGRLPNRERRSLEELFPIWVEDMTFALDEVAKLDSDPQSPFFARLDLNHVAAFGHSYGGAAAASACYQDERIKAAIDMDGSPRGKASTWQLFKPLMLLQSDHGIQHKDDSELLYQGTKVGYLISIKGSRHRAFTDWVFFPIPTDQREDLLGSIPGERMKHITSAYARGFFDTYLKNRPSPLLREPSENYPEVDFQKH